MNRSCPIVRFLWASFAVTLAGCDSLAVTAFGVGASAGVNQAINGTITRTFTDPAPRVRQATLAALATMGVTVTAGGGEVAGPIRARARGRDIDIEFEDLSDNSTRMRVIAQSSDWFFYDAATGREIVAQTEKALAAVPTSAASGASQQPPREAEEAVVRPVRLEPVPIVLPPTR